MKSKAGDEKSTKILYKQLLAEIPVAHYVPLFRGTRRGEIRKRYREGQEDQLGALGLVTNAVVLWNTIYMQDALHHLKRSGLTILDDDISDLSPLRHGHMNVLGRYSFTLADTILAGEHRPLNQLDTEFGND